jgi:quinoprotein dehydrogenase-associated probable ABC transporter substrate-binding protein
MIAVRTALAACAAVVLASPIPQAHAQAHAELVSATELRVCADPHDLPLSNDKGEGFENKIAELIAHDLNVPVAYTYFPDSQGFVRATLLKDRCDVIMGTVVGVGDMATTEPYYHTGYMLVTRTADHITAANVGDPALAGKRFGLIGGTPPTDLLVEHNLLDQTALYSLMVDTRVDQPSHTMLQDLVAKKIDVGLLWGPFVGYYTKQEHLPLQAVLLDGAGSKVRLDYHIAMGVRESDTEFRRKLNQAIERHEADITKILQDYGVPLLDEQGHLIATPGASAPG